MTSEDPTFTLHPNRVDVWQIPLPTTLDQSTLTEARALLATDELERADRFYKSEHSIAFITSHAWLRILLSRYLNTDPRTLTFATASLGKPHLAHPNTPLRYNLSHTQGRALLAITGQYEIGADIEYVRPIPEIDDIALTHFSTPERNELAQAPDAQQKQHTFHRIWTAKEALLKAFGSGLYLPLLETEVTYTPASTPTVRALPISTRSNPADWRLFPIATEQPYTATIAVPASIQTCRSFNSPSIFQLT